MRRDITFDAEGATLRGWLYLPEDAAAPSPVVVMAHGFTAVKEQYLDRYAEVFAAAGLAALVFDNRNFGASDGLPRQEIDPVQQVRDTAMPSRSRGRCPSSIATASAPGAAATAAAMFSTLASIDRRCAAWRPKCRRSPARPRRFARPRPDLVPALLAAFDADRDARFAGAPPKTHPVVADDPTNPCALPGAGCCAFFTAHAGHGPVMAQRGYPPKRRDGARVRSRRRHRAQSARRRS